jgi:ribonuclease P protein subunit RPR2
MPYSIRQLYCKNCKKFIVPGRTARVRVGRSSTRAIRITCLLCGHIYRKVIDDGVGDDGAQEDVGLPSASDPPKK